MAKGKVTGLRFEGSVFRDHGLGLSAQDLRFRV